MNRSKALALISIVLATLIAYGNSLDNDFVWDDEFLIEKNVYLDSFSNLPKMLTSNSTAGFGGQDSFYRPTQNIYYLLIQQGFGKNKAAFRLGNILLHLVNGLLLFFLLLKLFKSQFAAWASSLLWVLHPVHTEAVTYISGTADPMGVFFFLWTALFVPLPKERFRPRPYVASLALLVLSLLSKEAMVVVPALLTIIFFFKSSQPWRLKNYVTLLPHWAIVFLYLALRKTLLNFDKTFEFYKASNIYTENVSYRIYTFLATLPEYCKMLLLPVNLHMEREFSVYTVWNSTPTIIGTILAIGSLAIALFLFKKRRERVCLFSWLWFFAAFVPMCGILLPVNSMILEHWLYLPSISLFLGFGFLLSRHEGRFTGTVVLGLALVLVILTRQRNLDWRTPLSFYQNILKYSEGTARVHNNIAMAYSERDNLEAAISHYTKAIEIADQYPQTHYNLARVYVRQQSYDKALQHLERSLSLSPNFKYSQALRQKIKKYLRDRTKSSK